MTHAPRVGRQHHRGGRGARPTARECNGRQVEEERRGGPPTSTNPARPQRPEDGSGAADNHKQRPSHGDLTSQRPPATEPPSPARHTQAPRVGPFHLSAAEGRGTTLPAGGETAQTTKGQAGRGPGHTPPRGAATQGKASRRGSGSAPAAGPGRPPPGSPRGQAPEGARVGGSHKRPRPPFRCILIWPQSSAVPQRGQAATTGQKRGEGGERGGGGRPAARAKENKPKARPSSPAARQPRPQGRVHPGPGGEHDRRKTYESIRVS